MRNHLKFLSIVLCVFLTSNVTSIQAQQFPSKPIRIMVPHPAGGPTDFIARVFAEKLSVQLAQPVIVESRPGGNGLILLNATIAAPADGYTLALGTNTGMAIIPAVNSYLNVPQTVDYQKLLSPLTYLGDTAMALAVNPNRAPQSIAQFIEWAKANPGKLNYGYGAGKGGSDHLAAVLLNNATGITAQDIPYKGIAAVATALLSGEIDYAFTAPGAFVAMHNSGRLKILAVGSEKRMDFLPDVPTVSETVVPGFQETSWIAVWIRSGTNPRIVERLNREFQKASTPDLVEKVRSIGYTVKTSTPEQLQSLVDSDLKKWANLLKLGNIKF